MTKTAIVLFNLGGPDRPESVRPFLFNLFNDPAIIGAPSPIRWLLAKYISTKRAPVAREIYAHIGGKSPLLELTQEQANALEDQVDEAKSFICMRYWHPMTEEVVRHVKEYGPDRVVLLPLYPQYSTATTGSSIKAWNQEAARQGLDVPTSTICCYPTEPGFIAALKTGIENGLVEARAKGKPRVLFSAHGLPKKIVDGGDPYQWQVEQSAAATVASLDIPDLDWIVCFQSRVGPMEWIGPSTDDEIARAGRDGVPVVVVPLAFVSEHSETLVELDIEYRELAEEKGVPAYVRVPAVGTDPDFISGLAALVENGVENAQGSNGLTGGSCPGEWGHCPKKA